MHYIWDNMRLVAQPNGHCICKHVVPNQCLFVFHSLAAMPNGSSKTYIYSTRKENCLMRHFFFCSVFPNEGVVTSSASGSASIVLRCRADAPSVRGTFIVVENVNNNSHSLLNHHTHTFHTLMILLYRLIILPIMCWCVWQWKWWRRRATCLVSRSAAVARSVSLISATFITTQWHIRRVSLKFIIVLINNWCLN